MKFHIISILLILSFSTYINTLKPILIVPGLIGSALEVKLHDAHAPSWLCSRNHNWFDIWISIKQLTIFKTCFSDNMKLRYDNVTKTYRNKKGVVIRPKAFGNTQGVEQINELIPGGFKQLVEHFTVNRTYVRNKTITAAPYDFRFSPRSNVQWMVGTKALIEELYENNNNTKVVVVSQSMGCPYFLYFLNQQSQEWKDKHIDQWVSAGGVFAGTVQIGGALVMGEDMGLSSLLDKHRLREILRTWETFYWLQPNKNYWGKDEVIFQIGDKNYTAHNETQMMNDIGIQDGEQKLRDAQQINHNITAPGVKFVHAYSLSVPTQEKYIFKDKDDKEPQQLKGDGDGTVNQRSIEVTQKWYKEQEQEIKEVKYHGIVHAGLPSAQVFIEMLDEQIYGSENKWNF